MHRGDEMTGADRAPLAARLAPIRARADAADQSLRSSAAITVLAPRLNGKLTAQKIIASALDVPDLLAELDKLAAELDLAKTAITEIQKVGHQDDAGVEQALADYDAAKEATL